MQSSLSMGTVLVALIWPFHAEILAPNKMCFEKWSGKCCKVTYILPFQCLFFFLTIATWWDIGYSQFYCDHHTVSFSTLLMWRWAELQSNNLCLWCQTWNTVLFAVKSRTLTPFLPLDMENVSWPWNKWQQCVPAFQTVHWRFFSAAYCLHHNFKAYIWFCEVVKLCMQ